MGSSLVPDLEGFVVDPSWMIQDVEGHIFGKAIYSNDAVGFVKSVLCWEVYRGCFLRVSSLTALNVFLL
jgi:hypothetical protein